MQITKLKYIKKKSSYVLYARVQDITTKITRTGRLFHILSLTNNKDVIEVLFLEEQFSKKFRNKLLKHRIKIFLRPPPFRCLINYNRYIKMKGKDNSNAYNVCDYL